MIRRILNRHIVSFMRFSTEVKPVATQELDAHNKKLLGVQNRHTQSWAKSIENTTGELAEYIEAEQIDRAGVALETTDQSTKNLLINLDRHTVFSSRALPPSPTRSHRYLYRLLGLATLTQILIGSFSLVTVTLTAGLFAAAYLRYQPKRAAHNVGIITRITHTQEDEYEIVRVLEGEPEVVLVKKEMIKLADDPQALRIGGQLARMGLTGVLLEVEEEISVLPSDSFINNVKFQEMLKP